MNLEKRKERLLAKDFDNLGQDARRERVIIEQDGKCNHCTIHEWMGKPLSLELEHKDGDNTNNFRENLEALCPNCHSITETWRGRNVSKRTKVTDEEFIEALRTTSNIHQALIKLGLASKGKNYVRAKQLLSLR